MMNPSLLFMAPFYHKPGDLTGMIGHPWQEDPDMASSRRRRMEKRGVYDEVPGPNQDFAWVHCPFSRSLFPEITVRHQPGPW